MLFGISLLFGMTGTGDIVLISSRLGEMFSQGDVYPLAVLLSITFILAGVGYKIASVPFHMWSPDVYEGAPDPDHSVSIRCVQSRWFRPIHSPFLLRL